MHQPERWARTEGSKGKSSPGGSEHRHRDDQTTGETERSASQVRQVRQPAQSGETIRHDMWDREVREERHVRQSGKRITWDGQVRQSQAVSTSCVSLVFKNNANFLCVVSSVLLSFVLFPLCCCPLCCVLSVVVLCVVNSLLLSSVLSFYIVSSVLLSFMLCPLCCCLLCCVLCVVVIYVVSFVLSSLLCPLQYLTMVEQLESIDCRVKNAPYRKFRPDVSVLSSAKLWSVQQKSQCITNAKRPYLTTWERDSAINCLSLLMQLKLGARSHGKQRKFCVLQVWPRDCLWLFAPNIQNTFCTFCTLAIS